MDDLHDIWSEAMDIESSELKSRVSSVREKLESKPRLCNKILDFFSYAAERGEKGRLYIVFKKNRGCKLFVFDEKADLAYAVAYCLEYEWLCDEDYCTHVKNPFYMKSLEEIEVLLDLLKDTRNCSRAEAHDET